MLIWIFNHYASTPDQPMTGAYYLARALAKKGNKVTVYASSFSYYKNKEIRLKRWQLFKKDNIGGVEFVWVRTLPHSAKLYSRSLNILSYFITSIFTALLYREKPDVVIGTCPHLPAVLAAYIISKIKRAFFISEVRDLWPQSFVDLRMLSEKSLIVRLLRYLETFLYKRAKLVFTVAPYTYEYLERIGVAKSKVVWIPNGIDPAYYNAIKKYDGVIDTNCTVMYIGGHSKYQGIDVILRAAKIVQNKKLENIRFVFVGDGSEKQSYMKYSEMLDLKNVEFRDAVPRSEIHTCLSEASIFIHHLNKTNILKYGMASNKLCDYLISAKPIICAVDVKGDNDIVGKAGAGITIPSENPQIIAQSIEKLVSITPEDRVMIGQNGKKYVLNHLDVNILADKFQKAIQTIM